MSGGGYLHPDVLAAIGHFTVQTHLGQQGSHLLRTEAEDEEWAQLNKRMSFIVKYIDRLVDECMDEWIDR